MSGGAEPVTADPAPTGAGPRRTALQHIAGALRGEHYDYTQGSIGKSIFLLAVPMVLEMML